MACIPDESIVVNEKGGKQSYVEERCDLLPPYALLEVSRVLATGVKRYRANNWRKIDEQSHVNHAMRHLLRHMKGDQGDELAHAACRILMALEQSNKRPTLTTPYTQIEEDWDGEKERV